MKLLTGFKIYRVHDDVIVDVRCIHMRDHHTLVSHNKQITVRYRFQSEFETYAEVLEQCRNM